MGKTTLAQLAYNDENVKAHFEKSRWVCVSDPFDEFKIAKAIIGNDDTPISDEFDALMQSVSKSVKGKKFLLVLDDVWTEDDTKWKQLKLSLMSGAKGSRILVTTRKETVAQRMEATTHMIHLDKLSDQNSLSLFYHIAFLDREKDKTDLFEAIGNKIVSKCNGLPLAIRTLGSLMRYKNTPKKWHDVLNSEMWEIKEVEKNIFRPLLLSYNDLTSEIKRCLLLCASFPKDYQINKDKLIELWMSQSYLSSKRNREKRAIGQEYFDDLIMRSFFQDFQMDNYGKLIGCKMHDIVHDFVQFLTRHECFIIEADGGNQATVLSSESVHHLTLISVAEGPLSLPAPFHTCKKLRSLTIFAQRWVTKRIDGDLILQLKCLRALNLSDCNVKQVPKEIGELLHLRYIDLSWNQGLKELTLEFGENDGKQQRISDEEVLNALRPPPDLKYLWVGDYQGSSVPSNWIMSLQHLTHLGLGGFSYCECLPPLGKLPYLEVLDINGMGRVEKVGVELLGIQETQTSPATPTAFPKLKRLKFFMWNWKEWEGVGDHCQVTIMPCLSSLYIYAPFLNQLPDFLHNRPLLQLNVPKRLTRSI